MKRALLASALVIAAAVLLTACPSDKSASQRHARQAEQRTTGNLQENFLRNQPIPVRPYSQLRQNLIELETAQADTTRTTTFFFNQGVQQPVMTCPSIGFPIPSTSQLSNPQAKVPDHELALPQLEPNGVYTGDSTGTYVICIDAQGKAYASYWEGFVQTVTGPAIWNGKGVELTGPPSFSFTTKK